MTAAAAEDPALLAVGRPHDAILDLVEITSLGKRLAEPIDHFRRIFRMANRPDPIVREGLVRRRQPHELEEGGHGSAQVGRQIGIPDADAGRLLRQGELGVALAKRLGKTLRIPLVLREDRLVAIRH